MRRRRPHGCRLAEPRQGPCLGFRHYAGQKLTSSQDPSHLRAIGATISSQAQPRSAFPVRRYTTDIAQGGPTVTERGDGDDQRRPGFWHRAPTGRRATGPRARQDIAALAGRRRWPLRGAGQPLRWTRRRPEATRGSAVRTRAGPTPGHPRTRTTTRPTSTSLSTAGGPGSPLPRPTTRAGPSSPPTETITSTPCGFGSPSPSQEYPDWGGQPAPRADYPGWTQPPTRPVPDPGWTRTARPPGRLPRLDRQPAAGRLPRLDQQPAHQDEYPGWTGPPQPEYPGHVWPVRPPSRSSQLARIPVLRPGQARPR